MSAPPLQWGSRRRGYRLSNRSWRGCGRRSRVRRQDADYQPASQESKQEHSHSQPHATASALRCDGLGSRIPLFALAGIGPVVNACAGNGGRRVGPALGILAHAKAPHADGSPYAGLGQVQPDWAKFDALAESPRHIRPFYPLDDTPYPLGIDRLCASVAPSEAMFAGAFQAKIDAAFYSLTYPLFPWSANSREYQALCRAEATVFFCTLTHENHTKESFRCVEMPQRGITERIDQIGTLSQCGATLHTRLISYLLFGKTAVNTVLW